MMNWKKVAHDTTMWLGSAAVLVGLGLLGHYENTPEAQAKLQAYYAKKANTCMDHANRITSDYNQLHHAFYKACLPEEHPQKYRWPLVTASLR